MYLWSIIKITTERVAKGEKKANECGRRSESLTLKWATSFRQLARNPGENLAAELFLARQTSRRPWGTPWRCWTAHLCRECPETQNPTRSSWTCFRWMDYRAVFFFFHKTRYEKHVDSSIRCDWWDTLMLSLKCYLLPLKTVRSLLIHAPAHAVQHVLMHVWVYLCLNAAIIYDSVSSAQHQSASNVMLNNIYWSLLSRFTHTHTHTLSRHCWRVFNFIPSYSSICICPTVFSFMNVFCYNFTF